MNLVLNVIMPSFCSCLDTEQVTTPCGDQCLRCGKPIWSAEAQAEACGNCDKDQDDLCPNCPNRIPVQELEKLQRMLPNPGPRTSELFGCVTAGRQDNGHPADVMPNPVPMTVNKMACKLLRLERAKGTTPDQITAMIPETEKVLREFWEGKYGTGSESDCVFFIYQHPMMQYLAMLLKMRVCSIDASFRQLAHVVEGIAGV